MPCPAKLPAAGSLESLRPLDQARRGAHCCWTSAARCSCSEAACLVGCWAVVCWADCWAEGCWGVDCWAVSTAAGCSGADCWVAGCSGEGCRSAGVGCWAAGCSGVDCWVGGCCSPHRHRSHCHRSHRHRSRAPRPRCLRRGPGRTPRHRRRHRSRLLLQEQHRGVKNCVIRLLELVLHAFLPKEAR
jgi:hypothetical protein